MFSLNYKASERVATDVPSGRRDSILSAEKGEKILSFPEHLSHSLFLLFMMDYDGFVHSEKVSQNLF